jgi:hypothetical protein
LQCKHLDAMRQKEGAMTIRFSRFTVLALAAILGGAGVLAANIADAGAINHRDSGASTASQQTPRPEHGRGIFAPEVENNSGP